jgi:hypothetical protein
VRRLVGSEMCIRDRPGADEEVELNLAQPLNGLAT